MIREKEVNEDGYLVPANVSAKFEIFEGFGWSEAKYVVIALIIGAMLFFVSGLIKKTEVVNIKDLSQIEVIGLKEDANTVINGDVIKRKKEQIPKGVRFFFIIIPGFGTFIAVRRDPSTGMSLVTNVRVAKEFKTTQRRYLYKYNSGGVR